MSLLLRLKPTILIMERNVFQHAKYVTQKKSHAGAGSH